MRSAVLGILFVALILGCVSTQNVPETTGKETLMDKKSDDVAMAEERDGGMAENGTVMESGDMVFSFTGAKLAGKDSPLIDFNKADYGNALKTDKLVVLYFYANWCPICRNEVPNGLEASFNELTGYKVIGFRVNYRDDETTQDEIDLAREYGIGYQHTKVFIKNNERVLKSPESWDKKRYLSEIQKYE